MSSVLEHGRLFNIWVELGLTYRERLLADLFQCDPSGSTSNTNEVPARKKAAINEVFSLLSRIRWANMTICFHYVVNNMAILTYLRKVPNVVLRP